MTPIGGYFELEVTGGRGSYHPTAAALTSGRACLRFVLSFVRPRHVWLPYYSCEALSKPLVDAGVPYTHYAIDPRLEPVGDISPAAGELLIAVNYFGLKGGCLRRLAEWFGPRLVADDTQAFFQRGYPSTWAFNSARKFFGVPDGAYLYAPEPTTAVAERNDEVCWDHLVSRFSGRLEVGYRQYQASEAAVSGRVLRVSVGSERLLAAIDYPAAADRRRANFARYDNALGRWNRLRLQLDPDAVPLCYPFLPDARLDRHLLYAKQVFPPTYWPECLRRDGSDFRWERDLADRLLPLPLDQRYGSAEVDRVIALIHEQLETAA